MTMATTNEPVTENQKKWAEAYTLALMECYVKAPQGYCFPPTQVHDVAQKMIRATIRGSANTNSPTFRLCCKRLGIKYSATAIREFLGFLGPNKEN